FRGRLDGVSPPGPFDPPQLVRVEVADEDLMWRVAERVLVGAERSGKIDPLARRLRPVPDEIGRMREHERAAVDRSAAHRPAALLSHARVQPPSGGSEAPLRSRYRAAAHATVTRPCRIRAEPFTPAPTTPSAARRAARACPVP